MPVRFQGVTEYDDSYRWFPSYLSRSYVPSPEQAAWPAGNPSFMLGSRSTTPGTTPATLLARCNEPALQHRRRPPTLASSADKPELLAGGEGPAQDDYILLGDQAKFANSVRYRTKKSGQERFVQRAYPPQVSQSDPQVPLSPPPAPRPVPTLHKMIKEGRRDRPYHSRSESAVKEMPRRPTKPGHGPYSSAQKDLASPMLAAAEAVNGHAEQSRPKPEVRKSALKVRAEERPAEERPRPVPNMGVGLVNGTTRPKPNRGVAMMNGTAEHRTEKAVSKSMPEAGPEYVMKYRAGIAPPRFKGPKRLSEYESQFQWRNPVMASPMLAADQIVHQSSSSLVGPSKTQPSTKHSEYSRQFKAWPRVPVYPADDSSGQQTPPTKKQQLQRSKSMSALSPDQRPAAGVTRRIPEDNKRLVKSSLNPLRPYFPHGKFNTMQSEYKMNYQAPLEYRYEHGAWKGADPPHLQTAKTTPAAAEPAAEPDVAEADAGASNSWFSEVVELRKKAAEYKKRALGTHFSREHLAQLYARQAELWDTVSQSSSLSALSLEATQAKKPKKKTSPMARSPQVASPNTEPKQAWGVPPLQGPGSMTSEASSHTLVEERPPSETGNTYTAQSSDEGRVPTPKMRHQSAVGQWLQRHHLDRTTPAVGGALLTSPPKVTPGTSAGSSPVEHHPLPRASRDVTPPRNTTQVPHSHTLRGVVSSPTYGLPTRDTHPMLDEEASMDRALEFQYVQSPPKPGRLARKQEFQQRHPEVALPSTIQEDGADTYNVLDGDAPAEDNDDIISISNQSLASSCSLASEVLERARNRRDEFWGKARQK